MTEQLLRNCLKDAQEKAQIGILIWPNWTQWDEHHFEMKQGNKNYDFALSQVTKGDATVLAFEWNGFTMPGIIAVSVEKMLSSPVFFNHVLNLCEKSNYKGPITLVPLNEVSESC